MKTDALPAVDLSKDQDHLLDNPEFSKAYSAALHRSCKIMQQISDEAINEHKPVLLAELLAEDLHIHGFTSDEVREVANTLLEGLK